MKKFWQRIGREDLTTVDRIAIRVGFWIAVAMVALAFTTMPGCAYRSCGDFNMRLPGCAYDEVYIESLGVRHDPE